MTNLNGSAEPMESREERLKLVYVRPIGENAEGLKIFEFLFTDNAKGAWNDLWDEPNPSACGDITPVSDGGFEILRLISPVRFSCAQENRCFSMAQCMDGIIAVAYENIDDYEEYPSPIRFVFRYGETLYDVEDQLARRGMFFGKIPTVVKENVGGSE